MMRHGLTVIFVVLLFLAGCDRKSAVEQKSSSDPVLATVGDSAVRQSQFDAMVDRLTPQARDKLSGQLKDTILKGLVRSRALAVVTQQQLGEAERLKIDAKVQLYKDELLAQAYVQKNIEPQPVTSEQVQKYYQAHKGEYTIPGKVSFEYLATTSKRLGDAELDQALKAFSSAKSEKDWKAYAAKLQKKKIPVEYQAATMAPTSIVKGLRSQVDKLKEGEVSDVIYGDVIYVVKVIKRDPEVVKPINQVSVEIRKKLAPQQLKQVLSQHIDQALQKVDVKYTK